MFSITSPSPSPSPPPSLKRKANKMSVSQTYFLAHTARGKLSSEASRADHNLRLLVGHANLLDSLMLELAEAEQEQETWFNQSVRTASKPSEPRHIQWADAVVEDPEEDWQAEDADSSDSSDSDSDYSDDEEIEEVAASLRPTTSHTEVEEVEEFEDDGAEDYDELALHLTPSHSASPPDLEHDDSSDSSDDDALPPSPPADVRPSFSQKQRQQIATTGFYPPSPTSPSMTAAEQEDADSYEHGLFLPSRAAPGLISAISVY
jgi:hypothetical protein